MFSKKTFVLISVLVLFTFLPLYAFTVSTSVIVDEANLSSFTGYGMGGEITVCTEKQGRKVEIIPFGSIGLGRYSNNTLVRVSSDQPLSNIFTVSDYNGAYFARALGGIEISSKIRGVYCGAELGLFARSSWFCLRRTNRSDWSRKSFLSLGMFAHLNLNIPLKNNLTLFLRAGVTGQFISWERLTTRENKKIQRGDYSPLDKGSIGLSAGCGFSVVI